MEENRGAGTCWTVISESYRIETFWETKQQIKTVRVCVCLLGGRQNYHIAETFEHLQTGVSLIYFLTGMLHREENYYR